MAVTHDAAFTIFGWSGVTSAPVDGLTIGAISNGVLVAFLAWDADPGAITTCNWDQEGTPQALSQILAPTASGDGRYVAIYGLVAPTTGARRLALVWTNTCELVGVLESASGADQTGGATTFAHATSGTGNSGSPSLAITSATDNLTAAIVNCGGSSVEGGTYTQTLVGRKDGAGNVNIGVTRAAGAASVTHGWTISSNPWIMAGVDIVAAVGGAATITQEGYRWRMDDGDEANASWAVAQDTGITAPANSVRRLRVLLDTTGDANAANYQLEYKEANDADWTPVA